MANSRVWWCAILVPVALLAACNANDAPQATALGHGSQLKMPTRSVGPAVGAFKFGNFYWDTIKTDAAPGLDHISVMCPSAYPHAVSGGYEWTDNSNYGYILGSEPYGAKNTGWYVVTSNDSSPPTPEPIDVTAVCYNGK